MRGGASSKQRGRLQSARQITQGEKISLEKEEIYTIIDDADGVLIMTGAKKQLLLEGVDYEDIITAGADLFMQHN